MYIALLLLVLFAVVARSVWWRNSFKNFGGVIPFKPGEKVVAIDARKLGDAPGELAYEESHPYLYGKPRNSVVHVTVQHRGGSIIVYPLVRCGWLLWGKPFRLMDNQDYRSARVAR